LAPGQNGDVMQSAAAFARIATEAAARSDETGCVQPEVWAALHDSGLPMAPFATPLGGSGLGHPGRAIQLCSILRLLGGADLSVARLFEGHVNAVMLVSRYGTPREIEAFADSVAGGCLSGVWGAEDAAGLQRVAQGRSWLLEGRKILASGAGLVTRPLITVSTPEGPLLYLLSTPACGRADLSGWSPRGMKASASGSVDLTGVAVGPCEQIGETGDYMRQPYFSGGAWRFCAAQLGAMERLTKLYCEHLTARSRDGDAYQLERVAQCTTACLTAQFWIEEAARRLADESVDPPATVAFANLTRMVTERSALDVLERVERGIGLAGFMRPSPVERICRDLATYLRQPVPDLAMSDGARAVLAGQLAFGALS
jgi:alkylation response protein AidB-like acyl-CoA dehydrogenase